MMPQSRDLNSSYFHTIGIDVNGKGKAVFAFASFVPRLIKFLDRSNDLVLLALLALKHALFTYCNHLLWLKSSNLLGKLTVMLIPPKQPPWQ
jgi:hypothetical protein